MSPELRTKLRRAAGARRRNIDALEILQRGERMRRRRRAFIATAAAVLLLGAVPGLPALLRVFESNSSSVRSGGNGKRSDAEPTPKLSPTQTGQCSFPSVRPTYLPWLSPSERIPEPDASHLAHTDASGNEVADLAYLDWGSSGPESIGLTLSREDELRGGPGEPTGVTLFGAEGYLYTGPEPGEASILWNTEDEPCNLLSLHLRAGGVFTTRQAIAEVLRIATSLQS